MSALRNLIFFLGRLMLACIFIVEGWLQIAEYSATMNYMQANGVPGRLLPAVILAELGGGLLVASGLTTRLAAAGLALFCILTAIVFHLDLVDPGQAVHFLKNLAMAGGFLLLAASGPGAFSLDALVGRARHRRS